ncbi:LacI family DNA-binding transcriptional regulator [Chondrinema litorale]|uniref:LacI family DNA-binding transcriptional regulator n=1 Tax=Chondrinema litorale TaxID=2994555 RepID=UPI002542A0ED|nr:LacI family DNA-binding transcriptional regulator [Chondrinema litorale]UZR98672.1 LacI family DNA-binding transcriptional regulator [Chondrinema litorale]
MKKQVKHVTIYDIAAKMKISPATVSRALKDHYSISKETTKAVKKTARNMGYLPNTLASSLRSNKTNTIGVLVSRVNRPFISSLISGIEEVANLEGYNIFISQSLDLEEKEIGNVKAMFSSRVDGLIVSLAMETTKFDHFEIFTERNIPLVFVDRVPDEIEADKIVIDNFAAAFEVTEHLIEQGCKRIAHFGGAQHINVYHDRKKGYLAALQKHDLPVDEKLITYSNLGKDEGFSMTQQLLELENPPDAIFSANDTAAISAIQFAREKGIHVPNELAVVGFNDDYLASIISPSLTTVAHPAFEMGKIAANHLLEQKDKSDLVASKTTVLKTRFVIRESSVRDNK